jgi:hypothetical protein
MTAKPGRERQAAMRAAYRARGWVRVDDLWVPRHLAEELRRIAARMREDEGYDAIQLD